MSHHCLQRANHELKTNMSQLTEALDNVSQYIWMLEGQLCKLNKAHDD